MQNENNNLNNNIQTNEIDNINQQLIPNEENYLNNTPNMVKQESKDNGLGRSITSALIFWGVCVPYFIGCFQDDYGMFIVMGGFLLLPFIIICYVTGRLAINDYKKCTSEKTIFRKILNIINNITLIVITLPLILMLGIFLGSYALAFFPPEFIIIIVCIIAITAIYIYIKNKQKKK